MMGFLEVLSKAAKKKKEKKNSFYIFHGLEMAKSKSGRVKLKKVENYKVVYFFRVFS